MLDYTNVTQTRRTNHGKSYFICGIKGNSSILDHNRCTGLQPLKQLCYLILLTMDKRAIKPFDVVTIRIHNHDLITEDWHRQKKDCTKRHCQGKGAQPKPIKCHNMYTWCVKTFKVILMGNDPDNYHVWNNLKEYLRNTINKGIFFIFEWSRKFIVSK